MLLDLSKLFINLQVRSLLTQIIGEYDQEDNLNSNLLILNIYSSWPLVDKKDTLFTFQYFVKTR